MVGRYLKSTISTVTNDNASFSENLGSGKVLACKNSEKGNLFILAGQNRPQILDCSHFGNILKFLTLLVVQRNSLHSGFQN